MFVLWRKLVNEMSKAFKCDGCLELYEGEPELTDDIGNDICEKCVRTAKLFSKVDPFDSRFYKKQTHDKEQDFGNAFTLLYPYK